MPDNHLCFINTNELMMPGFNKPGIEKTKIGQPGSRKLSLNFMKSGC